MTSRSYTDNHDTLPDVFVHHLKREVKRLERIMKWFYLACASWVSAAIILGIYSHEVAVFIVEHWN